MPRLTLFSEMSPLYQNHYTDQLKAYNINSGLYGRVGHWMISNDGDILGCCNKKGQYPIYSYNTENLDYWINLLKTKTWFKSLVKQEFKIAFSEAKKLKK